MGFLMMVPMPPGLLSSVIHRQPAVDVSDTILGQHLLLSDSARRQAPELRLFAVTTVATAFAA